MVDFCIQRKGAALFPVSEPDMRDLLLIPERRVYSIEVHPKAPPKIARWYRAGVDLLVEATGRWPDRSVAHREIMWRTGYIESFVISTNGDTRITAASQQGWDFIDWQRFLLAAMPVMMEFAGESRAQFRDRVDRFFGIKLQEIIGEG